MVSSGRLDRAERADDPAAVEATARMASSDRVALPRSRRGGELFALGALVLICLLGLALRLDRIGARSLWLDEIAAYGKAVLGPAEFLDAVSVNFNMVLYYFFINVYYHLYLGVFDEQAFRLPSAIFGTATIPLVFWLGRRCHSATAGVLGALALSLNVFHVA